MSGDAPAPDGDRISTNPEPIDPPEGGDPIDRDATGRVGREEGEAQCADLFDLLAAPSRLGAGCQVAQHVPAAGTSPPPSTSAYTYASDGEATGETDPDGNTATPHYNGTVRIATADRGDSSQQAGFHSTCPRPRPGNSSGRGPGKFRS